jgi:hypothetical protein
VLTSFRPTCFWSRRIDILQFKVSQQQLSLSPSTPFACCTDKGLVLTQFVRSTPSQLNRNGPAKHRGPDIRRTRFLCQPQLQSIYSRLLAAVKPILFALDLHHNVSIELIPLSDVFLRFPFSSLVLYLLPLFSLGWTIRVLPRLFIYWTPYRLILTRSRDFRTRTRVDTTLSFCWRL